MRHAVLMWRGGAERARAFLGYVRGMGVSRDGARREPPRVLLVEPEPRSADVLSEGLELDGHEVVVAEDGEVGAFLAATEPFDLIVLDLALPGSPGLEIVERIRHADGDIPIVALSDRDDPDARRAARSAGASEFVAKPLVVEALRATVMQQLARRPA